MTAEQLKHYLNGGCFTGIYAPTRFDISTNNILQVGNEIKVYQNCDITPILEIRALYNQHRFNSRTIEGWIPEEDIKNLSIINEYIEFPELIPQYILKIVVRSRKAIKKVYGKKSYITPPYTSYRSYSNKERMLRDKIEIAKICEEGVEFYSHKWEGEKINEKSFNNIL